MACIDPAVKRSKAKVTRAVIKCATGYAGRYDCSSFQFTYLFTGGFVADELAAVERSNGAE